MGKYKNWMVTRKTLLQPLIFFAIEKPFLGLALFVITFILFCLFISFIIWTFTLIFSSNSFGFGVRVFFQRGNQRSTWFHCWSWSWTPCWSITSVWSVTLGWHCTLIWHCTFTWHITLYGHITLCRNGTLVRGFAPVRDDTFSGSGTLNGRITLARSIAGDRKRAPYGGTGTSGIPTRRPGVTLVWGTASATGGVDGGRGRHGRWLGDGPDIGAF